MVRQRKTVKICQNSANNIETSSSSGSEGSSGARKRFHILSRWKTGVGIVCFCIAVLIGVIGYLETRVNTPFYGEKVSKRTLLGVLLFIYKRPPAALLA